MRVGRVALLCLAICTCTAHERRSDGRPLTDVDVIRRSVTTGAVFNTASNASSTVPSISTHVRVRRQSRTSTATTTLSANDEAVERRLFISGYRVEMTSKDSQVDADGVASVLQDSEVTLRVFGGGGSVRQPLSSRLRVQFVTARLAAGASCAGHWATQAVALTDVDASGETAVLRVYLPPLPAGADRFYMCVMQTSPDGQSTAAVGAGQTAASYFQGDVEWLCVRTYPPLLPVVAHIVLLVIMLFLSGLFSGLNLGLMALTLTELKIVTTTGTSAEKGWARAIIPVRSHGNYLLCTLLLGNVLVNSSLTILLDDLTSGVVAVIGSTLGIVICGEIVPQALCSRHGLAVGAKTIYLTKLFMLLTAPLSFPISLILDKLLGEEIGNTYNRDRLKELIKLNKEDIGLENEEQNIIYGALDLKAKSVSEIMTQLDDVYMLPIDAVLDYDTISEIMAQGYSRIPVFESERANIVAVMLTKDLAFVDPDDCTPIKTLCHFYQHPWSFVFEDVTLDAMLREFKTGNKGHMAFVQRVVTDTDADPFYEVVGLVTLEDVIEEMIQAEIVDETDVLTDNRTKKRRKHKRLMPDPTSFSQSAAASKNQYVIAPQLSLAAFQFLQTLDSFGNDTISPAVLKRILDQDVVRQIKLPQSEGATPGNSSFIYELGKSYDYFCLILEGRVQAVLGREALCFESGPFSYYGTQALCMTVENAGESASVTPAGHRTSLVSLEAGVRAPSSTAGTFVADYTVRAITDVCYLLVRHSQYAAARRATLVSQRSGSSVIEEHLTTAAASLKTNGGAAGDGVLLASRRDSSETVEMTPLVATSTPPPLLRADAQQTASSSAASPSGSLDVPATASMGSNSTD